MWGGDTSRRLGRLSLSPSWLAWPAWCWARRTGPDGELQRPRQGRAALAPALALASQTTDHPAMAQHGGPAMAQVDMAGPSGRCDGPTRSSTAGPGPRKRLDTSNRAARVGTGHGSANAALPAHWQGPTGQTHTQQCRRPMLNPTELAHHRSGQVGTSGGAIRQGAKGDSGPRPAQPNASPAQPRVDSGAERAIETRDIPGMLRPWPVQPKTALHEHEEARPRHEF